MLLVLDVPSEASLKITEELWLGVRAKRLIVWGTYDDFIVGILDAKALRVAVRRKDLYDRSYLTGVIEARLHERESRCSP